MPARAPSFFLIRKILRPREFKWLDQGPQAQLDPKPVRSNLPSPTNQEGLSARARIRSHLKMAVVGWELGWTLGHLGSRLKSAKNLWCNLGQAKCTNASLLKVCLQCARTFVCQPHWACDLLCGCSEQLHLLCIQVPTEPCGKAEPALDFSCRGQWRAESHRLTAGTLSNWVKVGWS